VEYSISEYALARESYKELFPNVQTHHMVPRSRGGSDTECNLFPWNEGAHSAWHRLFAVMTVQEVWVQLRSIHRCLFETDEGVIVRMWCLSEFYHRRFSKKQDVLTPQSVAELRRCWISCFGGTRFHHAEEFLRLMMLVMAFGRFAFKHLLLSVPSLYQQLLEDIKQSEHRLWAFRECLQLEASHTSTHLIQQRVHRIWAEVILSPTH